MEKHTYQRPIVSEIITDITTTKKRLLHILIGPRQVGKTTAAHQIEAQWHGPVIFASADAPLPPGPEWIRHFWEQAARQKNSLLIIDETQKVKGWAEIIKSLWDEHSEKPDCPAVILLGSSSLLIQKGLSESLAGRFFLYRITHWTYPEMQKAFGFSLDKWIFFGGYPGAASFCDDFEKWSSYVRDSLIETVLVKDVFQLQNINKPALLRHLFMLSATFPAEILSYTKMLGQLQDAGNTTTLSHYITLLEAAYLVSGLELYKKDAKAKRGSSPKLILWNNALITALSGIDYNHARNDNSYWGRLVENAVGGYLLNNLAGISYRFFYWRQGADEVDFIVQSPHSTWAIEVKSGKPKRATGLEKFRSIFPECKSLIIGQNSISLEEFFSNHPKEILR
jgi:predicted AAA+ superfamily ATPase